jgi:hypothetical protein
LRLCLTRWPRFTSNLWSSCLSLNRHEPSHLALTILCSIFINIHICIWLHHWNCAPAKLTHQKCHQLWLYQEQPGWVWLNGWRPLCCKGFGLCLQESSLANGFGFISTGDSLPGVIFSNSNGQLAMSTIFLVVMTLSSSGQELHGAKSPPMYRTTLQHRVIQHHCQWCVSRLRASCLTGALNVQIKSSHIDFQGWFLNFWDFIQTVKEIKAKALLLTTVMVLLSGGARIRT